MINKVIEDLEVEIQNSSSTYESTKLKYKLNFFFDLNFDGFLKTKTLTKSVDINDIKLI